MLTDDPALRRLCSEYWDQDDAGEFVRRVADLELPPGVARPAIAATVRQHSQAIVPTILCIECQTPWVLQTRADLTNRRAATQTYTCPACRERQAQERQRVKQEEAQRRDAALMDWFSRPESTPGADYVRLLSLRQATLLLAAIRVGADADMEGIRARRSWTGTVSPRGMQDEEILDEMRAQDLVHISEDSAHDAFTWTAGEPTHFTKDAVRWCVGFGGRRHRLRPVARALEDVLGAPTSWPAAWHLEVESVWREVAQLEVLAYLDVQVAAHHLPLKIGDRLRHVVEQALTSFSPGQLFNFSWRAARDAAAFYQRGGVTKAHAGNIVPGAIERSAERGRAEGWDPKPFRRDRAAPECAWSALIADVILQVGTGLLETQASTVAARTAPARARITELAQFVQSPEDEIQRGLLGVPETLDELLRRATSDDPHDAAQLQWILGFAGSPDGEGADEPTNDAPDGVPKGASPPPPRSRPKKRKGKRRKRR